MGIKTVLVVGSGLMGSGIAQVCAQSGIQVYLNDVSQDALERAKKNIEWSVGKFVEKGKLTEDKDTSAIPISELAAATQRPENVLGLHFFSPVPMMQAVEVIKGVSTAHETALKGKEFVRQIGKEPIMVNRDVAGFVINRINFPSAIEAMNLVEQGVATVEDIDKGLRMASGRRMGIFETGDMVGLDITYGAMMAMYHETGDPRWYPPLLLRRKVKAGHLGRKSGKGWYEYNEDGSMKKP